MYNVMAPCWRLAADVRKYHCVGDVLLKRNQFTSILGDKEGEKLSAGSAKRNRAT